MQIHGILKANPQKGHLTDSDWLPIVTSMHYLQNVNRKNKKQSIKILEKLHSIMYLDVIYNTAYKIAKNI